MMPWQRAGGKRDARSCNLRLVDRGCPGGGRAEGVVCCDIRCACVRSTLLRVPATIRLLLIADTHLGFDLPVRPGTGHGRRGEDFFRNFHRALLPAFRGEVDLVVHGGDVFFRSQVKPGLVLRAFEPLKQLADAGVPVVVVPGNHERSAIPYPILAAHPGVHVIDRPRTVKLTVNGTAVALSGFPCERNGIRERFSTLVDETGWRSTQADVRLLCLHQTVEGATVGPAGYVFRRDPDVIAGRAIPEGFAAVLAGHIHRHQVLRSDLNGRRLAAPVFYPGSIERTSTAENCEEKGFVTMELEAGRSVGGRVASWSFHELESTPLPPRPARPYGTRYRSVTTLLEDRADRSDDFPQV